MLLLQLAAQARLLRACALHARVRAAAGQAAPVDLLLLLGNDVHRHQHVERVVHAPPDVLLVELRAALRACTAT